MRKFLLATGERGLGYTAVFGNRPLTMREFELYYYIQSKVLEVSNRDPEERSRDQAIHKAIELESRDEEHPQQQAILDPTTATPEEIAAWMARYNSD